MREDQLRLTSASCNARYEDHDPPDDSCLERKKEPVRITTNTSSITDHEEKDQ